MVIRSGVAVGLALAAGAPTLAAEVTLVQSLQQGSALVTVDSAAPGTVVRSVALSGLATGERLIGFDARPLAGRALYGLSNTGQVYAINGSTGIATALGAPLALTGFPANAGFDFNPSVDRIRIVTDADQNFRINPDTGAIAAMDPNVAYAAADSGAGLNPAITGAAYTNNVPGGTPTVLYLLDTNRATLVTQGSLDGTVSPNSGALFTVGPIGVASTASTGFDISATGENIALITDAQTGAQGLYRIDLTTGVATLIGAPPVGPAGSSLLGLAFTQAPLALSGTTANQVAIGGVLDGFTGVPSAGLVRFLGAFDGLDDAATATALGDLSPAAFSLLPDLIFQAADVQDATLRRYLRDVRAGGTDARDDVATVGPDRKIGMFFVGTARAGVFDGEVDRYRTKHSAVGGIAGIDYRFTPDIVIGVAGGYDDGEARLNRNSAQSDIETWFVGGYATAAFGPFYVDAHGSYGKTDFDLRRTVAIGSFLATNRARPESENWSAAGTVGGSFQFGSLEVEPYLGARYVRVEIDDFTETGDAITALSVIAEDRVESLQSIAGLRIGGSFPVGNGAVFRPSVRGEYRHEFENDDSRFIVANFAGAGVTRPFGFTTTPLEQDFAAFGAGFTVSGKSPISLVVDYNGEVGKDRSVHGITGGFRLAF